MGANLSVEEKVFKCAKSGDAPQLQSIIRQLQAAGANVPQYLEYQDATGITPLIVACKSYDFTCVDMLLRHGANLHHFSRRPEGTTALHEAVARGNLKVAELLLQYGANPFMENGRGLTCVDLAINKGNTAMVRSLELRSNFTGTLQLKVSKYMGLGAEWKSRWVVIMPRYQMPANPNNAGEARVARSLLVCYKTPESCEPVCKVWLDGAVARSVTGSRGSGFLQCALSLHRSHALAGGALMTGDAATGYTMHLRPPDGTAQGSVGLRRSMEIVNGSRMVATPEGPSQSSTPTSGHSRNSSLQRIQPAAAVAPHVQPGHTPTQSDEELARYLQQQYDAEAGGAPVGKRPPSPIRNPQGPYGAQVQHGYPPVGQTPPSVSPTVSSQRLNSRPSAPLYPNIDLAASSSAVPDPQAGTSSRAQWYPDTVQAQAPPTSAAGPLAEGYPAQSATTPAAVVPTPAVGAPPPGQAGLEDDEAGNCVICMDNKATAGFLHGDSVHKCCCKECATDLKAASTPAAPLACPMCRKKVEHVIFSFY